MVRLLLITIAMLFSFQAYGAECGLFRVVKGKVTYQKKNKSKFRKARVNKKVCAGDKIKTAEASRTKIVMADGNELNISPSTELLIEQYERNASKKEKKVLLNVLYGKIRSNVKDKYKDTKNNHYRVKTKSAVAGVRGTEFMASFNASTNQSRVVTFEGKVAVGQFKNGNFVADVTVKPGQFTSNSPGQKPHEPRKVPPKEFAQLDQETNFDSPTGDSREVANDPKPDSTQKDDNKTDDQSNDQPKNTEPNDGANNEQPSNGDGQANVDADGTSGSLPGDSPDGSGDQLVDTNDPNQNGVDGSRDPASVDDVGSLLPEPELPDDVANIDTGIKLPAINDINDIDMTNKLPDQCVQCNNAIQNRKVKITIVPVISQ